MDVALSPSESASMTDRGESNASAVGAPVSFVTVADLVHAHSTMDSPTYQQLVGVVQTQQRIVDKCLSLQFGALRAAGGSAVSSRSDGDSGEFASSRVSGRNSRLASIRRAASWRKKTVPEGLCYTTMLRPSCAASVVERLGQWPALASLLKLPASNFMSIADLERHRIVGDGSFVHVKDSGFDGVSLLPAVARVAQGFKSGVGSFGAVLCASGVRQDASSVKLNARTAVGGLAIGVVRLPFVVPECRSRVVSSVRGYRFADLFCLPSEWFLSLEACNSLWISGVGKSSGTYEFSLTGEVHFASFVSALVRSVPSKFLPGMWGHDLLAGRPVEHCLVDDLRLDGFFQIALDSGSSGFPVGGGFAPDGSCYTQLLDFGMSSDVLCRLGGWPSLGRLLGESSASYKSIDVLEGFSFLGGVESVHVAPVEPGGSPLTAALASVAAQGVFQFGTLGALVCVYDTLDFGEKKGRLELRTLVGGASFRVLHGREWTLGVGLGAFRFEVSSQVDCGDVLVAFARQLSGLPVVYDNIAVEGIEVVVSSRSREPSSEEYGLALAWVGSTPGLDVSSEARVVIFFLDGEEYSVVLWDSIAVGRFELSGGSAMRIDSLVAHLRVARAVYTVVDGRVVVADVGRLTEKLVEVKAREAARIGVSKGDLRELALRVMFRHSFSVCVDDMERMPTVRLA